MYSRPADPFNVVMFVYIPEFKTVKGSTKKIYPENGGMDAWNVYLGKGDA